ncbi:hypothetical protein V6N13_100936 [Hibiscus sabdariffa]
MRVIERLNDLWLYWSQISVALAQRRVRNSYWWRKRGKDSQMQTNLIVHSDDCMVQSNLHKQRQVFGGVDESKVDVLSTCAIGRCKNPISIANLASKISHVNLQGCHLMRILDLMLLIMFTTLESRKKISSKVDLHCWFERVRVWTLEFPIDSRQVWLSIYGMPMHAWSMDSFMNVAVI